jgi:hypothetical protein
VFSFHSTDGASSKETMGTQILYLLLCAGFHGLGPLARFIAQIFPPPLLSQFHVCECFITIFIAHFPVISLRHSLVSDIYITAVNLTQIIPVWRRVRTHPF